MFPLESPHRGNSNEYTKYTIFNSIKKTTLNYPKSAVMRFFTRDSVGGRVVRRCWVNSQCRGVLLIWNTLGQGPTVLAVGAGGGCVDIFSLVYHFSLLSPSLWETARHRLKYCLKGPLSPKQPTNQGTQKRVRNRRGERAISVRATEVLL